MKALFHADDYAVSMEASKSILSCIEHGRIRSISIMPNMSCFEQAMELLSEIKGDIKIKKSVHFNIVEGYCVTDAKKIPLLVDQQGLFSVTWGKLLIYSITKRRQLRGQLALELHAQIKRIVGKVPMDYKLRLDSHQHTHMIPYVFKVMVDVSKDYETEYIRVASEKTLPFLKQVRLWKTYDFANLIKHMLLKIFGVFNKRRLKGCPNIEFLDFMGLIFSGCMDKRRVNMVLPDIMKASCKGVEVLFHPGCVLKKELNEEFNKQGFNEFHVSNNRIVEENAVLGGK